MSLSKEDIKKGLRKLGIKKKDLVMVHSSLSSLGYVEGGADTVIDAFLDVAGKGGTVVMPTIIHTTGKPRPAFDVESSPSEAGLITEKFRKRNKAERSFSPTHSVAAIGYKAKMITKGHRSAYGPLTPWGESAFGKGSPWEKLYKYNARYILLGVNYDKATIFHYVQTLIIESYQGSFKPEAPFPFFDMLKMGKRLEDLGLVKSVKIGMALVRMLNTKDMVDISLSLFKKRPLDFFSNSQNEFVRWYKQIPGMQKRLKAGAAKIDITPRTNQKINGRLFARVLLLKDKRTTFVLVVCDLIGLRYPYVKSIRKRITKQTEIPEKNIMICCTHNHSGPNKVAKLDTAYYTDYLEEKISKAVYRASRDINEVRIGTAKGEIRGIGKNRRIRMEDGKVFTVRNAVPSTWNKPNDTIKGTPGPIDPELGLIKIEKMNGELLSVVTNYGCHNSVALTSRAISSDFFGQAISMIEEIYGKSAIGLCTAGTEGDVDPTFVIPVQGPRNDFHARRIGRIFGAQIIELLERTEAMDGGGIKVAWKRLRVPVKDGFKKIIAEMQIVRINDLVLVGIPGEVFAGIGLEIKQRSKYKKTFVISLANGTISYIPTNKAFREGGYEVDLAIRRSNLSPGVEDIIKKTALDGIGRI